ncbi:MAG: deoxyhypusine synthase [candidate division Zixibacteria bacterium SM23_73_3]|nr:MAG: deoxyhypusine synthase [candidate division Zixibacteria bacterium SM23_73_3]
MSENKKTRKLDDFGDGFIHGLKPLRALDLSQVTSFEELLVQMADTAFGARNLGEAFEVYTAMLKDPDCFIVGTFSGAMTMAKMGLVLCEMIDRGFLDAVVSTGALVMHGLVENVGAVHFKHATNWTDDQLYQHGYNRVYDTIEAEKNLRGTGFVLDKIWEGIDNQTPCSSTQLLQKVGEYLFRNEKERGILKSAWKKKVPVYIPAFTDSELGLNFSIYNRIRKEQGKPPLRFDPFLDLQDYARRIQQAKQTGIFTIGGGVPRNWSQQVGPYLEAVYRRFGEGNELNRFKYGVRICPEPVHWGGLSGCTYSEGLSWGKFVPKKEGGEWAEVLCDATIAWPILIKAVMERFDREGLRRNTTNAQKT